MIYCHAQWRAVAQAALGWDGVAWNEIPEGNWMHSSFHGIRGKKEEEEKKNNRKGYD